MKTLYSSTNVMEMVMHKSRLAKAGIACEIRNDAMTPAMLERACYPELCVQNDADFMAASLLLAAWQREKPATSRVRRAESLPLQVMAI